MLKKNNSAYMVVGGIALLLLFPFIEANYFLIYALNIINFIVYFLIINYSSRLKTNKTNLLLIVVSYSLLFVILYNSISLLYDGNYFLFSNIDAVMYHNMSKQMASMSLSDSIAYFLNYYSLSDLGIVLVISSLYRIIESNLVFNLLNIFIGACSALGLFRLGTYFMSRRYAFVCSLTFALSSYVIWFHSSGLKESIMVMIIILFFDQCYMYLKTSKVNHIVFAFLYVLFLVLFRPVLTFFCIGSMSIGYLLSKKISAKTVFASAFIALIFVSAFSFVETTINRFVKGGDIALMIAAQEASGMVIGSLSLTYSVNILAQLIGPLPSMLPSINPKLSLYSVGQIYRVLLSFPFWLGVYFIFKFKNKEIYPLVFFVLMEMVSLAFILEGLELRKSLPHFPMVYIVAFWFMDYFDKGIVYKRVFIKYLFTFFSVVTTIILFYWNFR